jgi:23S rRNA (cytidine2498-2'-O)-methyltransferase
VLATLPFPGDESKLVASLEGARVPTPRVLQAWTLDVAHLNPLAGTLDKFAARFWEALGQVGEGAPPAGKPENGGLPVHTGVPSAATALAGNGSLVQLCLIAPGLLVLGSVAAREAVSLAVGGRARMSGGAKDPSRAALKLEEALSTYAMEPGRGEVCVDLGAAPGGWTQRLIDRGARVIAVDPAKLTPALEQHPKVDHRVASAFSFEPDEPVDWLFCDMAWRPLEVAQLLAKWARRGWALHLIANIKLPMNDKNPILHRVRHTLVSGGWNQLRVRQLYHDRDEVTVTATRSG